MARPITVTLTSEQIVDICKLYANGSSLRELANLFGTNHHYIKRVLTKNNSYTSRRPNKQNRSEATKAKMSIAAKKRGTSWNRGKTLDESYRRSNMKAKLKTEIDLSVYPDFDKLQFLTKLRAGFKDKFRADDVQLKVYLDHFYSDTVFNTLFNAWKESGKPKWLVPSLDHKVSLAKGGTWDLDNLRITTWFENHAKSSMTLDEWELFKQKHDLTCKLFV